jgi:uncharacterized membrane protein YfcA
MLIAILLLLGVAVLAYGFALLRAALAARVAPRAEAIALGAVVNFFDALGIGSFAPTTAWFKFRRMVPDRLIPQTMLVGLTPPSIAESIIFLATLGVVVEPVLLFSCVIATFLGGLLGVRLVNRARVWIVQAVVTVGLVIAAIAYAMQNLDYFPKGGTATGLPPTLMVIAIVANFGFGILANFGVGNFAPTLVLLSLMGMDPHLCFPIMATGASLMGVGASVKHIKVGEIDLKVVLGLALGGIPAVLVAALIVRDMPIVYLRWLVLVVVVYAAAVMAHAAIRGRREHKAEPGTAPVALEAEAEA